MTWLTWRRELSPWPASVLQHGFSRSLLWKPGSTHRQFTVFQEKDCRNRSIPSLTGTSRPGRGVRRGHWTSGAAAGASAARCLGGLGRGSRQIEHAGGSGLEHIFQNHECKHFWCSKQGRFWPLKSGCCCGRPNSDNVCRSTDLPSIGMPASWTSFNEARFARPCHDATASWGQPWINGPNSCPWNERNHRVKQLSSVCGHGQKIEQILDTCNLWLPALCSHRPPENRGLLFSFASLPFCLLLWFSSTGRPPRTRVTRAATFVATGKMTRAPHCIQLYTEQASRVSVRKKRKNN